VAVSNSSRAASALLIQGAIRRLEPLPRSKFRISLELAQKVSKRRRSAAGQISDAECSGTSRQCKSLGRSAASGRLRRLTIAGLEASWAERDGASMAQHKSTQAKTLERELNERTITLGVAQGLTKVPKEDYPWAGSTDRQPFLSCFAG